MTEICNSLFPFEATLMGLSMVNLERNIDQYTLSTLHNIIRSTMLRKEILTDLLTDLLAR